MAAVRGGMGRDEGTLEVCLPVKRDGEAGMDDGRHHLLLRMRQGEAVGEEARVMKEERCLRKGDLKVQLSLVYATWLVDFGTRPANKGEKIVK